MSRRIPPDAGRRALERLDRGGVVVRLDLERHREAVSEVDDARVLARALQHALARRGQPPQQRRRVLVAAVLRTRAPRRPRARSRSGSRPSSSRIRAELPVGQTERAVEWLLSEGAQAISVSALPGRSVEGRRATPRRQAERLLRGCPQTDPPAVESRANFPLRAGESSTISWCPTGNVCSVTPAYRRFCAVRWAVSTSSAVSALARFTTSDGRATSAGTVAAPELGGGRVRPRGDDALGARDRGGQRDRRHAATSIATRTRRSTAPRSSCSSTGARSTRSRSPTSSTRAASSSRSGQGADPRDRNAGSRHLERRPPRADRAGDGDAARAHTVGESIQRLGWDARGDPRAGRPGRADGLRPRPAPHPRQLRAHRGARAETFEQIENVRGRAAR